MDFFDVFPDKQVKMRNVLIEYVIFKKYEQSVKAWLDIG